MPRRIEIELTSHADGVWTWRAAGARQPKGSLADALVPQPASVGDVFRAEVESGLEGLEIVNMLAKPAKVDAAPTDRIEVIGAPQRGPDVSVTLAPGSRRRRDDDDRPRRDGAGRRDGAPRRESRDGAPRREGRDGAPRREGSTRREGRDGPGRRDGLRRGPGGGPGRPAPDETAESRIDGGGPSERRGDGPPPRRERERERKPTVSTAHRNALLATLGPEQLPVAEQLLRGGIPAVRSAIAEQKGHGGVAANADPLLAIAEQLLPVVNLASWKDRATTAQSTGKELRLRELRAVVAASRTVTLDEEGRVLAKALRDALEHRVTALRDDWQVRVGNAIDSGRMVDALRIATRPPEPATRLPADLAVRVAAAAGAAMTAEAEPAEWLALLEVVLESPVRRTVKPAGIPPAPETQEAARRAAGLVPELAKLLGLRIPPPPPRRVLTRLTAAGGGGPAAAL